MHVQVMISLFLSLLIYITLLSEKKEVKIKTNNLMSQWITKRLVKYSKKANKTYTINFFKKI